MCTVDTEKPKILIVGDTADSIGEARFDSKGSGFRSYQRIDRENGGVYHISMVSVSRFCPRSKRSTKSE